MKCFDRWLITLKNDVGIRTCTCVYCPDEKWIKWLKHSIAVVWGTQFGGDTIRRDIAFRESFIHELLGNPESMWVAIHESIFARCFALAISRKFSPAKASSYSVRKVAMGVTMPAYHACIPRPQTTQVGNYTCQVYRVSRDYSGFHRFLPASQNLHKLSQVSALPINRS